MAEITTSAVREAGVLPDVEGIRVHIGHDCDTVFVGCYRIGPDQRDHFMRLLFEATFAAEAWAREHAGASDD